MTCDASLYLELLKNSLTASLYESDSVEPVGGLHGFLARLLFDTFGKANRKLVRLRPFDLQSRQEGREWPRWAHTMVGLKRLDNLQSCLESVLARQVPGDFIETGVWRGGASIFMRAVLKAHGVADRRVWVADSFAGLPPPDAARYPQDAESLLHKANFLAVSVEEVRANFARYNLLDDQVIFLKGWFRETLPPLRDRKWALIRLDGDLYESTTDGLVNLYPNLSPGGYLIVDDYGAVAACRQAVEDYRHAQGILEPIQRIDWTGVFWQRE